MPPERGETPGNRLLASLDAAALARLPLEPIRFERGAVLAERGEPTAYVVFPVDALASNVIELEEGESIEVGLVGADGMTAHNLAYGVARAATTCLIQIPGQGFRLPAAAYRALMEEGGPFTRLALRYADAFMELVAHAGACNAGHGVNERCARWILLASDAVRKQSIALTQEYLGVMLGVRRASVSSAESFLRAAGAIDHRRGIVEILDREKLERLACSCYRAMNATVESPFSEKHADLPSHLPPKTYPFG